MTSETALPEIGRRISSARLQRGLSQRTVARRTGIAASYLSRVENGKIQPTFRMVQRILLALGVDLGEILGPDATDPGKRGTCPVTGQGSCLLDLIRSEEEIGRLTGVYYTPREIRLLRRLAAWMKHARPDRLRAMEILLEDMNHAPKPSVRVPS